MLLAAAPRPRIITHRIGGLSAIQSPEVQAVIWKRDLAPQVRAESSEVSSSVVQALDFVTLSHESTGRVQQQLRKVRIESQFLAPDIALLVSAFGELCKARRIRVRLGAGGTAEEDLPDLGDDLRLLCAYQRMGMRKAPSDGHVMVLRGPRRGGKRLAGRTDGFFLQLDPVGDKA